MSSPAAIDPEAAPGAGVLPRLVPIGALEEAALEIMRRAAIDIPDDYKDGIRRAMQDEEEELLAAGVHAWEGVVALETALRHRSGRCRMRCQGLAGFRRRSPSPLSSSGGTRSRR